MSLPVSPERHRRRRRRFDSGDEVGETSTQIMVMVPILMLFVLLGVQAALYYHAANVAMVAASRGAGAGSARGAGEAVATEEAQHVALDNGASIRSASASAGGDTITVTVTIEVAHLVPFFPESVTRVQSEPVERFIVESER